MQLQGVGLSDEDVSTAQEALKAVISLITLNPALLDEFIQGPGAPHSKPWPLICTRQNARCRVVPQLNVKLMCSRFGGYDLEIELHRILNNRDNGKDMRWSAK